MPSLKAKDMIRLLELYRWREVDHTGSHKQLAHPALRGRVTVECHDGKDLPDKTVHGIFQHAGMEEFYRMLATGGGFKATAKAIKRAAAERFDAPQTSDLQSAPQLQPT
ncbi:MAG TPA: type II toxin-antitoxin system HicA family toxin [Patescibacteria group bacterium]|nr:type II toxin-antitoxin system HicA family toxin [Patescibacteria group bacterium]